MISLNDVLLAMSNIPVDDPIAEIWGRGLQEGYKIIEYTGSLPITINANGDALLDYRIYGADGGVGVATENLFDIPSIQQGGWGYDSQGDIEPNHIPTRVSVPAMIPISPEKTYTMSVFPKTLQIAIIVTDENNHPKADTGWNGTNAQTISGGYGAYVTIRKRNNGNILPTEVEGVTVTEGSTAPESYIPYGYKLPMMVSDQNLLPDNISQFADGYITPTGSISTPDATKKEKYSDYVSIVPNTSYTFAMANGFPGNPSGNIDTMPWRTIAFYRQNKTFISRQPVSVNDALEPSPFTVTSPSDAFFVRVSWRSYGSEECPVLVTNRNIYPVYIGENQLDAIEEYRDYVDFGIQKIARKIREYTFTGNETFNLFAQNAYGTCWVNLRLYTTVAYCPIHQTTLRSSHFTAINNSDANFWYGYPQLDDACNFEVEDGYDTVKIFFRSTANFSTAEECKAYFKEQYDNGTPVKIWFVMKYTVGQYESTDNGKEDPPVPLPEIPTIDGTTVIDYDGDPKPSQMYVKYKGKG